MSKPFAGYNAHPAAELFPLMEGAELQALADDIKEHGLRNPVVLYGADGEQVVLDGRNRVRACELIGVGPSFVPWSGAGSPTEWVVSQNLHRRHLDASQRAMVAVGLLPLFEEEAKERQRAGGGDKKSDRANLPEPIVSAGRARDQAAAAVSVSARSVEHAARVTREATPEIIEAV